MTDRGKGMEGIYMDSATSLGECLYRLLKGKTFSYGMAGGKGLLGLLGRMVVWVAFFSAPPSFTQKTGHISISFFGLPL